MHQFITVGELQIISSVVLGLTFVLRTFQFFYVYDTPWMTWMPLYSNGSILTITAKSDIYSKTLMAERTSWLERIS